MGKRYNIKEIARLISLAIVHKIGEITNSNAIYAEKYKKEYNNFIMQAESVKLRENWNNYDMKTIKEEVRKETFNELMKRTYIDKKKFDILDEEMKKVLKEIEFN